MKGVQYRKTRGPGVGVVNKEFKIQIEPALLKASARMVPRDRSTEFTFRAWERSRGAR